MTINQKARNFRVNRECQVRCSRRNGRAQQVKAAEEFLKGERGRCGRNPSRFLDSPVSVSPVPTSLLIRFRPSSPATLPSRKIPLLPRCLMIPELTRNHLMRMRRLTRQVSHLFCFFFISLCFCRNQEFIRCNRIKRSVNKHNC